MSKKTIIGLFVLVSMLVFSILQVSAQAMPLTLTGTLAECSVNPDNTSDYTIPSDKTTMTITGTNPNCLYNLYMDSVSRNNFIDELKGTAHYVTSIRHVIVEAYCGCDFSLLSFGNDGSPSWITGSCPDGYENDGVGNCLPTEAQRQLNLQSDCEASGKTWNNGVCGVQTSTGFQSGAHDCVDSDNGKDANVKGTVIYQGKSYTDSCTSTGTAVKEFSCDSEKIAVANFITCPSNMVCSDGACVFAAADQKVVVCGQVIDKKLYCNKYVNSCPSGATKYDKYGTEKFNLDLCWDAENTADCKLDPSLPVCAVDISLTKDCQNNPDQAKCDPGSSQVPIFVVIGACAVGLFVWKVVLKK
jgi:hypothetical protein